MGSCLSRSSFTVNKNYSRSVSTVMEVDGWSQLSDIFLSAGPDTLRSYPVLFSMADAEHVLRDTDPSTYLLYRDFESNKIYLSVRVSNRIRHHRITEVNRLYYLEKQPYPYLDSIILYHRRRKLLGVKLKQQAQLSARVVKAFAQKVVASNGNLPPSSSLLAPTLQPPATNITSRSGSLTSLITSSSDSTMAHARI